ANDVIQTGDAAALAAAVAPDFVDHAGLPGVTPDRDGLGRYLLALHAVAPAVRLTPDQVVADGDRAMAQVAVDGSDRATFLGLAVGDGVAVWGDADDFRVADRRVAERWSDAAATVGFAALGRGLLGASLPAHAGLALEHVALPPGDHVGGVAQESRLV